MDGISEVINRQILAKIRDKEMDRKDFLKYSGLLLLGVVGLQGVLSVIAKLDKPTTVTQVHTSRGFGSGKYGG